MDTSEEDARASSSQNRARTVSPDTRTVVPLMEGNFWIVIVDTNHIFLGNVSQGHHQDPFVMLWQRSHRLDSENFQQKKRGCHTESDRNPTTTISRDFREIELTTICQDPFQTLCTFRIINLCSCIPGCTSTTRSRSWCCAISMILDD